MGDLREVPRRPLKAVRDEVIGSVRLNYAHGNRDEQELEESLYRATEAASERELVALTRDLP